MPEIIETTIESEMQTSYIAYAMSVIVGRALPDVRDGLKPVQRRILYGMYKLNNMHNQPTKKSARVTGEIMGKYHPHGDSAIYEALIRMAQPFTMNHTLVEGQGNMGSIDGDPPAAARYTEVRLAKLAEEMLDDIDKESVQFMPNFDGTEKEPVILPSKVPNLLINGSSGIAVGVATNILPHNLIEVCDAINAYIGNKEITSEELTKYIKGPDFPTGGTVFYTSSLYSSYITGRGSVTIRGKAQIEEKKNEKNIIITEIPYNVNKSILTQNIAALAKDKVIQGITGIRDESGKEGIRIVIDLKKDTNPEFILNTLYVRTQLQVTMPVMNIAVMDNSLLTLNIRQFVKHFVDHRINVITSRIKFDLNAAKERFHILEGLIIATSNIEAIVATIKKSEDTKTARENLMNDYSISQKQANAILDMKLSKLTSLEASALKTESNELTTKIKQYEETLAHEHMLYQIIKEETEYLKKEYGTPRKTVIEPSELPLEIEQEDMMEDADTTILLTASNYIKRLSMQSYKLQERGGKGMRSIQLKEGDIAKQSIYCRIKDTILAFSNAGRAYWIKAYKIPEGDRYGVGKAAINLFKLKENEKIERLVNTSNLPDSFIIFITKKGRIKRVRAEKFAKPRSSGINAIPLGNGDSIADICTTNGSSDIFISTKNGKSIRFKETDIRPMSRIAHGIRGIRLKQNDEVVNIIPVALNDHVMSLTENGYGKITEIEKYRIQHRGGSGLLNIKINDKTGKVVKSLRVIDTDNVILISSNGISIQFNVSSVRKTGRAASGVRIMRIEKGNKVVDAQVINKAAQTEGISVAEESNQLNGGDEGKDEVQAE